ncbi:MAG: hypothetical protein AAFW69_12625, partial [Pseudomonadota bacterium]
MTDLPLPTNPEAARAETEVQIERAAELTRLGRTAWITMVLGCLYVWLALAGFRDIQLFRDDEGLMLPFANIEIAPGGFFVFAPALLLAAFFYVHLTLARLWRCYARIKKLDSVAGETRPARSRCSRRGASAPRH